MHLKIESFAIEHTWSNHSSVRETPFRQSRFDCELFFSLTFSENDPIFLLLPLLQASCISLCLSHSFRWHCFIFNSFRNDTFLLRHWTLFECHFLVHFHKRYAKVSNNKCFMRALNSNIWRFISRKTCNRFSVKTEKAFVYRRIGIRLVWVLSIEHRVQMFHLWYQWRALSLWQRNVWACGKIGQYWISFLHQSRKEQIR